MASLMVFFPGFVLSCSGKSDLPIPSGIAARDVSAPISPKAHVYDNVTVTRVIDGDTFELESGEQVKLIGIDFPAASLNKEVQSDSQKGGQDRGATTKTEQETLELVKDLVENKNIRLEFDVQKENANGQLLAYVYVPLNLVSLKLQPDNEVAVSRNSGVVLFVNAFIIKAGYAAPMTVPPNIKYDDLFQKLYQEAREDKRGSWK